MVESLLKFITAENLFTHEDKLLLAVSGGIDSMVMAQLFLNAGISFSIAHVNYNLRGADSVADMKFVKSWAVKHEINFHFKEVQSTEYESSESIQMLARKIRYDFFQKLINENGYNKIATAHHLDDSFETVLLNLVKGTGPMGLKGIPIRNENVFRPLMFATRDEIQKYASDYNIKWREDISNSKTDYQRNLIRREVTDILKKINPSLPNTFRDTLLRLEGAALIVTEKKAEIINRFLTIKADRSYFETTWLVENNKDLLLLSEILSEYGFNFKQCKDVFRCILDKQVGKIFTSDKAKLNVDREKLIIDDLKGSSFEPIEINKDQTDVKLKKSALHFEVLDDLLRLDPDPEIAFIDYELIKWPITIRPWSEGDHFIPLGMKGKKMISDFMIDSKIPLSLKSEVLIMESDDRIVWVIGHRISDLYKITPQTKKVLKISVRHA